MNTLEKINLPIPEYISQLDIEKQKEIYEYLSQMDIKDKIAYNIAFEHLGTSFHILRSNGFTEWKNKKK